MPFIDFVSLPKVKVEDGVHSQSVPSGGGALAHLCLSSGSKLPERAHSNDRWIYITEGQLEFYLGNKREVLIPGMAAHIPANEKYRAQALTECKCIEFYLEA